jgi:hypothetical protein
MIGSSKARAMRAAPAVMSVDRHAGLALKAPRLPRLELWGGQGAATTRASAEGKPQRVGGVREHRVMLRWRPSSRPAFACSRKRCARGTQLGEIAKANPAVAIGSYPFFDPHAWAQHERGAARPRCTEARASQTRGRGHARASAASKIAELNLALSRRKQGFDSPRECNDFNDVVALGPVGLATSPTFLQWPVLSKIGSRPPCDRRLEEPEDWRSHRRAGIGAYL